jgi:hypothetical protein
MHRSIERIMKVLMAGMLICVVAACARPYYLTVNYHLPADPGRLAGQTLTLFVEDQRENQALFSESAQKEFDLWDGTYALALGDTPPPEPVETLDLAGLFHQAMKSRLEAMQISVVEAPAQGVPALIVSLEKVAVDLKGKTWLSEITYQAQLSRDSSKVARETVSGQAERAKLMGMGGGRKLTGELFTDVINKLDVQRLFENAGLL